MAAMKSSRVSTRFASQTMPSVLRVDKTSAASFGSSSKCSTWSGDFIGNFFLFGGQDFTAWHRSFFSRCKGRWFINCCPKDAKLLDRLHKLGKTHRFHHVGVDAVFIKLNQIRGFARGSEHHDRNYFQ